MMQLLGRVVILVVPFVGFVTPALGQLCGGGRVGTFYCNDAGTVPVALLVRAVNVALGKAPCPADPGRFEDTGLTVIDYRTGLEWEKKTGTVGANSPCPGGATCADPHNVNNRYQWSATGEAPDGSAYTDHLGMLNACVGDGTFPPTGVEGGFAGHCDWRLPDLLELQAIVDCGGGAPLCVDPVFGPTAPSFYWSSSSLASSFPFLAGTVGFSNGDVNYHRKATDLYVRAVRGRL